MRIPLLSLAFLIAASAPALAQRSTTFFEQSFEFRAGDVLEISTSSPDIVIETRSGRNARVIVEGSGPRARAYFDWLRFSAERSGDGLVVRTNSRGTFTGLGTRNRIRITIAVPDRADIHVHTASGDITSNRIRGDVHIRTASGDVRLGDVDASEVEITTASGDVRTGDLAGRSRIEVTTASGDVRTGAISGPRLTYRSSSGDFIAGAMHVDHFDARTASGDIRAESLSGTSSVTTGSGDLRLRAVRAAVEARTGSGNVEVHLVEGAPVDARTGSGSVTIHAPRNLHATIDLRGGALTVDDRFRFIGERERRRVHGTINGGGSAIGVQTGSGAVRLLAH
jgi:hypothetical protein